MNNSSPNGHSPVLNLSKSADGTNSDGQASNRDEDDEDDDERLSEPNDPDDKEPDELSDTEVGTHEAPLSAPRAECSRAPEERPQLLPAAVSWPGQLVADPALSSTETLLRNIQGLLKVAADNARQQERQINYEKAELKMGVLREKETRESMERKLQEEQKLRVMYQRRLKKERRFRRKLQEQLGHEAKRRGQYEDAIRSAPTDAFLGMQDKSKEGGARPQTHGAPPASSPMSDPRGVFYGASPMFSSAT
ncbi:dachshund homolog 2-like [Pollicipes pollicipes]|uniref:dachshund homolog 2-like n=1 Tax=Pollicipes pollicipes TaxID=41117 RepID=UPI0018854DFC|nr:dachshund homolog 2-like [Pollicipes pollicipes]